MASWVGIGSYKLEMFSSEIRRILKSGFPCCLQPLPALELEQTQSKTQGSHIQNGNSKTSSHLPGLQKRSDVGHVNSECCLPVCSVVADSLLSCGL